MTLIVERRDGGPAKAIVTAMIVDRQVLSVLAPKWDPELFDSKWCNLVGSWCVRYFNKYGRPPKEAIEHLYDEWLGKKERDKDTAELVARFLQGLSSDYVTLKKGINSQFVIDQAGEFFNRVRMKKSAEKVLDLLANGEADKAQVIFDGYEKLQVGVGSYTSPFSESAEAEWDDALNHKADVLIRYPDGLGGFFGDSLEREGFIAFMGPEKTGKTWWLQDTAFRGVEQERRVAFFACGDMTKRQMYKRFATRMCKRPLQPKLIKIPKYLELEGEEPVVEVEEKEYTDELSKEQIMSRLKKIQGKGAGDLFRLSVHANSSINVHGIRSILQDWARNGWVADVVVIDYADILAPINGAAETRDQINATWKALSALRQDLHCLVVTATQSDAAGYKAEVLGKSNFSEDKRKLAHCTGMVGLNVNKSDKDKGLYRLNWVVLREGEFTETKVVYTAGCLAIGNPCILSRF